MNKWEVHKRAYRHALAEGDLAEARRFLGMAVECLDKSADRELAKMLNQIANVSLRMNDAKSAEENALKAIEAEKEFGPPSLESDHLAAYTVTLALALGRQGKYAQALTVLNRGIYLFSQHLHEGNQILINLEELRNSFESERWRESD